MKAGLNASQGKKLEATIAYLAHASDGRFEYHGDIDLQNVLKALQYKSVRCVSYLHSVFDFSSAYRVGCWVCVIVAVPTCQPP